MLDVEQLQAAIRVLPLEDGPARPVARLDPPDAAEQAVERLGVIERVAEFDPGGRGQEARELAPLRPLDPRQQDGDDPEGVLAVLDPTADRQPHLLVMPGAEAPGADEHGTGGAIGQGRLDVGLPGRAGDQVPLVEPGLEALPGQAPGQFLDQGLVGGGMRQEDIEASGHGSQSSIGSAASRSRSGHPPRKPGLPLIWGSTPTDLTHYNAFRSQIGICSRWPCVRFPRTKAQSYEGTSRRPRRVNLSAAIPRRFGPLTGP